MRFKIFILFALLLLNACAHLKEARTHYRRKNYQDVIRICRTAITADSTDTDAWLLLSQSYFALDSLSDAMTAMETLLTLTPRTEQQNEELAGLYFGFAQNAKDPEISIPYLLQAEQLSPRNVIILDSLAALFLRKGQYDLSKQYYNRLIDLSDDPSPYMNQVNTIEHRQTFARDACEKGLNALNQGRESEAETQFKKAVLTDPNMSDAVYQYGMLAGNRCYRSGTPEDLAEGIQVLSEAVRVKPEDIEARYLLAKCCERKGQSTLGEAITQYEQVLKMSPRGKYAKNCRNKIEKLKKRKAFWESGRR